MNGGSAKFTVVLILLLVAGGAFAFYTFYGEEKLPEILGKGLEMLNKVTGIFNKDSVSEKTEAVKKHDKPDSVKGSGVGGKSVNDILGGPEFSHDGAAPALPVVSHGGAPEPKVSEASKTPAPGPEIAVAAAPPPLPPPPAKKLPPFPKTNVPTLNFTAETQPEPEPPPKKQPAAKPEPAKSAQAAAQPEPAKTAQAATPPPPPPKPRTTLLLANISGRLSDRADVIVNMSVELTYENNNALREELEFKRDMLSTVAVSVLRRHEYGNVNTTVLKTELLNVFNGHLHAGKLVAAEIKDFQIGQAVAGK